jgi:hypothetical protein
VLTPSVSRACVTRPGGRLGTLPVNLRSPTGASPESPRSTSDPRSEVLRGDSGEVPAWAAGRSGPGLEGNGAKGWAFGEPSCVWRAERKAGDGGRPRSGTAHPAIPGCRKLPPMRQGQESTPSKTVKGREVVRKWHNSNRLRDPPARYPGSPRRAASGFGGDRPPEVAGGDACVLCHPEMPSATPSA